MRVRIEHLQALDRALRRKVDVAADLGRGGDEEHLLVADPASPACRRSRRTPCPCAAAYPGRLTADARPERTDCEGPGVGLGGIGRGTLRLSPGVRQPDRRYSPEKLALRAGISRAYPHVIHVHRAMPVDAVWKVRGQSASVGRELDADGVGQHLHGGHAVGLGRRLGGDVAGAGRVAHEHHRSRALGGEDARVVACVGG